MPSCVVFGCYVSARCLEFDCNVNACRLVFRLIITLVRSILCWFDWLLVCAVVRYLVVKLVRSVCVVFDFYVCTLSSVVFDFYVNARGVVLCSVLCCVDC